jgi:hypothetical protein
MLAVPKTQPASATQAQVFIHQSTDQRCAAILPPTIANTPIPTMPQPGTAVNTDARSIAPRMKLRLSSARNRRSTGGSSSGLFVADKGMI